MSDVNSWIKDNTIFYGVLGSRAYGLHNENSDYDYRGVCVAPKEYYLGLDRFDQQVQKDPDCTIFDIQKFFNLAQDCNPNIVEFLYLDKENVITATPVWNNIVANRDLFLSKRAKHRYVGYAVSQLKRVKSHRHWLQNPLDHKPTREEYGLPATESLNKELLGSIEFVIKECLKDHLHGFLEFELDRLSQIQLRNYCEFDLRHELNECFADFVYPIIFNSLTNKVDVLTTIGCANFSEEIMIAFAKEKQYQVAMNHWKQYETWVINRNPARAELEKKFGYDSKHLGHVFRLLFQGEEIMKDQTLHVKLNDENREFILAIKSGVYKYDQILEMAENRMLEFDDMYKESTLQHSPNMKKINNLLIASIEEFYGNSEVAKK